MKSRLRFLLYLLILLNSFTGKSQVPVANFSIYPNPACEGSNVIITDLSSNSPTAWSYTLAGATPSIANVKNPIVTYSAAGIYTIALITSNVSGASLPTVQTITIAPPPISPAITGTCQTICSMTATLSANPPAIGTGTWSVVSGSGVFAAPSQPTSGVNFLSVGNNIFLWSIANPGCISSATTCITRVPPPTVALAGATQSLCANSNTTTISGNTPLAGTGIWTIVSGIATIANPSSPTTTVTGLGVGINVLQWSISNGACPASTSTMAILVDALPTIANAGPSQTVCSFAANLNGNNPMIGSGTWSLLSGTGTIVSASSPTTSVINLGLGINIFQWTISNGVCPASTSTVAITATPCGLTEYHNFSENIYLYPNPTSTEIRIEISDALYDYLNVEIYNSLGQPVAKYRISQKSNLINLSEFSAGIYHIRLMSGEKQVYKNKVIKN